MHAGSKPIPSWTTVIGDYSTITPYNGATIVISTIPTNSHIRSVEGGVTLTKTVSFFGTDITVDIENTVVPTDGDALLG